MAKITYREPGRTTYVDLPLNNIIYVLRGTTVTFKLAGPEFGGVQQVPQLGRVALAKVSLGVGAPMKQANVNPGGGGGGLPVPADVTVTFNTASASATDYKDTVVSCGGTNMTARAIVFTLTPVITPLDDFRGPGAVVNDLGVDERVNLGVTIAPATLTPVQVGGLKWKVEGTSGGMQNGTVTKSATDKALVPADGTAHYVAPFKTGDLVFAGGSMTPTGGMRKNVTLQLTVDSGPSKGSTVNKVFTIHTPIAEMRDTRNQYQHVQNFPSAGFKGDIYLVPTTCSFRTLEWREGGGTATATGYFLNDHGKPHHPTGTNPSGGSFNTEVRTVGNGHLVNGSWVRQIDSVWTGYNPVYPAVFGPGPHAGQATNVASTMSWKIYWQYRVAGASGESWIRFQFAEHRADMDATGRTTISKAGTTKTFNLGDATVAFP